MAEVTGVQTETVVLHSALSNYASETCGAKVSRGTRGHATVGNVHDPRLSLVSLAGSLILA